MAVTLEQAKLTMTDDLQKGVIDEFQKSSWLWNNLIFDDVVSPTGGNTFTYSYNRIKTQPTADFRAVNKEYTPQEPTMEQVHVNLAIFGGSFSIDRAIADTNGTVGLVEWLLQQKIKAATALFNDTVINGNTKTKAEAFDGLETVLTGSSTECQPGAVIDLSTKDAIDANYMSFLDTLDDFLMGLDGQPSAILGNSKLIGKIRACARRATMYQTTNNTFGQQVMMYDNIPLIDLGTKAGSNDDVVNTGADGTTSLYAVRLGLDGLHACSRAGMPPIQTFLPDFTQPGAVHTGEVEMMAAIALRATKAAGVMRKIKVKAATAKATETGK